LLDAPAPIATLVPRLLADQIERTANEVFDDNKLGILLRTPGWKTEVTRLIKQTIGDLGQELGYHVAASGFPHFDRGWVYDVVWFVPGHGRFEVIMAMESELDPIATPCRTQGFWYGPLFMFNKERLRRYQSLPQHLRANRCGREQGCILQECFGSILG
jgi:hypothetical protein